MLQIAYRSVGILSVSGEKEAVKLIVDRTEERTKDAFDFYLEVLRKIAVGIQEYFFKGEEAIKGNVKAIGSNAYLLYSKSENDEWIIQIQKVSNPILTTITAKNVKAESVKKIADVPTYQK